MTIVRKLDVGGRHSPKLIFFGEAVGPSELTEVFKLRYAVYAARGYIDPARYPDGVEQDEYDKGGRCRYFVARYEESLIGCIRLIKDDPLPTEKYFTFTEPEFMQSIPRDRRCELGRFIIIPPDRAARQFLPRGLVMLFLFDVVNDYAHRAGILGGYSFIKRTLERKMKRLQVPVRRIEPFSTHYPDAGVLRTYFSQPADPVVPVCFQTEDFGAYIAARLRDGRMFERRGDTGYVLRATLYTDFLKALKVI